MLKLYAIRDRMLDYYQRPIALDNPQDLLATLARRLNNPEAPQSDEISQAPDHFEVWQIATVDDQGHIGAERQFITNCSNLIRGGVRKIQPAGGSRPPGEAAGRAIHARGAPGTANSGNGAAAVQDPARPAQVAPAAENPGTGGSN